MTKNAKSHRHLIYQVYSNNANDDSIRNNISAMHSDDATGGNSFNNSHTVTDAATTATAGTTGSTMMRGRTTSDADYALDINCSDSTVLSNNYSCTTTSSNGSTTAKNNLDDTQHCRSTPSPTAHKHSTTASAAAEPLILASSSLSSNSPGWIESVDHCCLGDGGGDDAALDNIDKDKKEKENGAGCCSCFRVKTWKVEKVICVTSSLLFLLASLALVAYFGCQHVLHHDYYYEGDDYNNDNVNDDDDGSNDDAATTKLFQTAKMACFALAYAWFLLHVLLEFFLDTGIQKRYMEHMRYSRAEAAAAVCETDYIANEDDDVGEGGGKAQERFSPELSHLNLAQSTLFGIAILSQGISMFLADQDLVGLLFLNDNNDNDSDKTGDDYYEESSSSSTSSSSMAAWTATITTASRWLLFVAAVFYFISAAMTMASRGCCGLYCLTRARVLEHQHRRHACIVIMDVLANALYVLLSVVFLTVSMSFDIVDVSNTSVQFHVQDYYQDYQNHHDNNGDNDSEQQHHYYHGKIAFLEIIAIVWVVMGLFYFMADIGRCCFYEDREVEGLVIGRADTYYYEMAVKGSSVSSATCGSRSTNNEESVGIAMVDAKLRTRVRKLLSSNKDGQLSDGNNSVDDATGILERDGYYSPLIDTHSSYGGGSMVELIRPPSSRPLQQPLVIVTTTLQRQELQQQRRLEQQREEADEEKSQPYQPPSEIPMPSMPSPLQPYTHFPPSPGSMTDRTWSSIAAVETTLPEKRVGSTISPVEDVVLMSSEGPIARCLSQQEEQQQHDQVGKRIDLCNDILETHIRKPSWLSTTMSGPQQANVDQQQEMDPEQQLQRRDNMCPIAPPAVIRRGRSIPTDAASLPTSSRVHVPFRSSKSSASVASESSGPDWAPRAISPPAVQRRETQLQQQEKQNQWQTQPQPEPHQQDDDVTKTPSTGSEVHDTGDSKHDTSLTGTNSSVRRWRSSPETTGENNRNRVAELLQLSDYNNDYDDDTSNDDDDDDELVASSGVGNNRTSVAASARKVPPRPLIMSVNTGTSRSTTAATTTAKRSKVVIPLPPSAAEAPTVSSQPTTPTRKKPTWSSLKKYRKYTSS